MEPRSAQGPETHHYQGKRVAIALGGVCGVIVLVGVGLLLSEGTTTARLVGLALALAAVAGWVVATRRIRAGGVRIEPGRIGRVAPGGSSTRWCDLDAVALATVHRYSIVFGGQQLNLVLWTTEDGDRGLRGVFARTGMSADQRTAVAAAEAASGATLTPFIVDLGDLPEGAGNAILQHVGHLR